MPGRFRTMKRVLLVLPLLNLLLSPLLANDSSTSGERETLKATINKNSTHWSFKPVTKPDIPTLQTPSWARNAIDHFVLSKLELSGLSPSSEADKETLIRRLSLDLLGLLPKGQSARCLRKTGRFLVKLAALRRTMGTTLVRSCPIRRQ